MTAAWYGDTMSRNISFAEQEPSLLRIPGMSPPPPDLLPVVEDLCASNAQVVTLGELAAYDTGREPRQVARGLRERGWLFPLPVQGAWGVSTANPPFHVGSFITLRARLSVDPATPVCIGSRSVAEVHGWLRRPTAPAISYFGPRRPPAGLKEYRIVRWQHRIPLDEVHGLPVWRPETLLAYMSVHPSRFPWSDIAEWLWELCDVVDSDLVADELLRHSSAAWARAAYLLHRGGHTDAAQMLVGKGPDLSPNGPHYFGRRIPHLDDRLPWIPIWASEYNVVDYLVERNWSDDLGK